MGENRKDKRYLGAVVQPRDQAVLVAGNVKHRPPLDQISLGVDLLDLCERVPVRLPYHRMLALQAAFQVRMMFDELADPLPDDDLQAGSLFSD